MNWKYPKKKHKIWRKYFAILPIRVYNDNDTVVWLDFFDEYTETTSSGVGHCWRYPSEIKGKLGINSCACMTFVATLFLSIIIYFIFIVGN